jgi:hypothetical protein
VPTPSPPPSPPPRPVAKVAPASQEQPHAPRSLPLRPFVIAGAFLCAGAVMLSLIRPWQTAAPKADPVVANANDPRRATPAKEMTRSKEDPKTPTVVPAIDGSEIKPNPETSTKPPGFKISQKVDAWRPKPLVSMAPVEDDPPGVTIPKFVVRIPSLEVALKRSRSFAKSLNREKQFDEAVGARFGWSLESLDAMLSIDLKRPLAVFHHRGSAGSPGVWIAAVPITNADKFRRLLAEQKLRKEKVFNAPGGQIEIYGTAEPTALPREAKIGVRFVEDHAYLAANGDLALLANGNMLKSAEFALKGRDKFLTATYRFDQDPNTKSLLQLVPARELTELAALLTGSHSLALREFQLALADEVRLLLEEVVEGGRGLVLEADVDPLTEDISIDLALHARPGSRLADRIAALNQAASVVDLLGGGPEPALSVLVNARLPEQLRGKLPPLISEMNRQWLDSLPAEEKADAQRFVEAIPPIFAAGEIDAAATVHADVSSDDFYGLLGFKVPNGAKLDEYFQREAREIPNPDYRARFTFSAERLAGFDVHSVRIADKFPPVLLQIHGDGPVRYAFRPNALIAATGKGKVALERALANPPRPAPVLQIMGSVSRIKKLIDRAGVQLSPDEFAFDAEHPGRFRLQLGGGESLHLHLGIDRSIFVALMKMIDQVAIPIEIRSP